MSSTTNSQQHVFVLGPGRSGTMTLARWLSGFPDCHIVHEHSPGLFSEVNSYLRGTLSQGELANFLRATRGVTSLGQNRIVGESNQRLSFVLPALHEAFPDAKYIWLLRDARANVSSMYVRSWYHPREESIRRADALMWSRYRLQGDEIGDVPSPKWKRMDRFEKCAWYWSYTHRTIEERSRQLGLPILPVRIEDIGNQQDAILAHIGLRAAADASPGPPTVENQSRRSMQASWQIWSNSQRRKFVRWAGELMDQWYASWRQEWSSETDSGVTATVNAVRRGVIGARSTAGRWKRMLFSR